MPRLLLQYPNRRTHEVNFEGERAFEQGDEFDLFGRTWRVIGRRPGGQRPPQSPAIVCQPVTGSALGHD